MDTRRVSLLNAKKKVQLGRLFVLMEQPGLMKRTYFAEMGICELNVVVIELCSCKLVCFGIADGHSMLG